MFKVLGKWIKIDERTSNGQFPEPVIHNNVITSSLKDKTDIGSIAGLEIEDALKRLNGNSELLLKLLKEFVVNYEQYPSQVRDAIDGQDPEYIRRLAHTLKGLAGNIAATDLQKAALDMEMAAREERLDEMEMLFPRLEKAMVRVVASIRILVDSEETNDQEETIESLEPASLNSDELAPLLKKLSDCLDNNDPVKAEEIMKQIDVPLQHSEYKDNYQALAASLDAFNFKKARSYLKEIVNALGIKTEEKTNDQ